ncbi:unnamed protein product [Phytophthora fragariaefolia]|uniref:Unnamed protein product n=1 Tax=Phytophthora fragariaefolia TaxID=1490495 RepID=A0A9W7CR83_9STRA|nr:unnamed protein product [Phytophthora fragariaefolia]
MAFGIVARSSDSKNPAMTQMISRIVATIYATRSNDTMDLLFAELWECFEPGGTSQLLAFKDNRFLGLTRVIRRILQKWGPLEEWFEERRKKAIRAHKPPPRGFPLLEDKHSLVQLLSLLEPISTLCVRAQSGQPNQVEVLLTLYRLRVSILDETADFKDRMRDPAEPAYYFRVSELTPIMRKTRKLRAQAFHKNFFNRYTDRSTMRERSYIPEAQNAAAPYV